MYHNMYDVRADILIERQQWANSGSTYGTYVHTASTGSTYVHTGRRGVRMYHMYVRAGGVWQLLAM